MRNQLQEAKHRFDNRFPKNPTQTIYFRFERTPKAPLKTMFTESVENFARLQKDINRNRLETKYSRFLE
jgi:hypothetical protein